MHVCFYLHVYVYADYTELSTTSVTEVWDNTCTYSALYSTPDIYVRSYFELMLNN